MRTTNPPTMWPRKWRGSVVLATVVAMLMLIASFAGTTGVAGATDDVASDVAEIQAGPDRLETERASSDYRSDRGNRRNPSSGRFDDIKTNFKTVQVGEVEMFYREAGPADAPVVLLLHGFPGSSHQFRALIPDLAEKYHVIAPDFPGFGSTVAPPRGEYDYTFDNLALAVEGFTEALELDSYALYLFDYGAPIGLRLATAHPERVTAIISQNGNAYEEGLEPAIWDQIGAYWADPSEENRDSLRGFLTLETTTFQYTQGVPEELKDLISPDPIAHDQAILDRDNELQLDLFLDYQTNVASYPEWQEYFRTCQPPFLAVWGNADPFFNVAGAEAFARDIPNAQIELFDAGHFALETHGPEIGAVMKQFLRRNVKPNQPHHRQDRPHQGCTSE